MPRVLSAFEEELKMKLKKEPTMSAWSLPIIALSRLLATDARDTKVISIAQRFASAWHTWLHGLLPAPVLGNPLHEAWSADGEPLERMTPDALAKCGGARYLIALPARGQ